MLLKLKNVKKNYKINKNEVQEVLKDINLTLKSGEFVCIYGESGSGKSTLMNIIGGLDDDYIGTVTINKKDIKKIDKDNYTYTKLNYTTDEYINHLNWLQNASIHKSNVALEPNSHIIIIQTCNYYPKESFLLISAKRS